MAVDERAIVVTPGAGQAIALGGSVLTLKAVGEDTGGAYAAMEFVLAPGGGAPRHVHHREDEAFNISEGTITFELGERSVQAGAGAFVLIPRGLHHAFVNAETQPAKALVIVSPAGLERYFQELDALLKAAPTGQLDASRVAALNTRYGLEFTSG